MEEKKLLLRLRWRFKTRWASLSTNNLLSLLLNSFKIATHSLNTTFRRSWHSTLSSEYMAACTFSIILSQIKWSQSQVKLYNIIDNTKAKITGQREHSSQPSLLENSLKVSTPSLTTTFRRSQHSTPIYSSLSLWRHANLHQDPHWQDHYAQEHFSQPTMSDLHWQTTWGWPHLLWL